MRVFDLVIVLGLGGLDIGTTDAPVLDIPRNMSLEHAVTLEVAHVACP